MGLPLLSRDAFANESIDVVFDIRQEYIQAAQSSL
jgi:hypothetical protein